MPQNSVFHLIHHMGVHTTPDGLTRGHKCKQTLPELLPVPSGAEAGVRQEVPWPAYAWETDLCG